MNCAEVLEAIARGGASDAGVSGHLAVCSECRARAASAETLGRHLSDPLLWEEPSPDLLDQVLVEIEGGATVDRPPNPVWRILGATAALAAFVLVGMTLGGRPDWTIDLAPGPGAPEANAVIHGWNEDYGTRMVVEVSGLEPTGTEAYYEMWLTAPDGRHVSAGTFRDSGRFEVMAGVRRSEFPRIWVTREPADSDPAPFPMTVLDMPEA